MGLLENTFYGWLYGIPNIGNTQRREYPTTGLPNNGISSNYYVRYMYFRWNSIVGYSVVAYSGQTWTEYPIHISYRIRWHFFVGYSVVEYSVVGYSGQTWTEYRLLLHMFYTTRWHSIVGYSVVGYSRRYCREYPTGNLELGTPDVGHSVREPFYAICTSIMIYSYTTT